MKESTFESIVSNTLNACKETLCNKNEEYSSDTDRLHNFKTAARINGITPEQALWGMYTKHLVSVMDIVQSPQDVDKDTLLEKITDSINYHLLLHALVLERKETANIKYAEDFLSADTSVPTARSLLEGEPV